MNRTAFVIPTFELNENIRLRINGGVSDAGMLHAMRRKWETFAAGFFFFFSLVRIYVFLLFFSDLVFHSTFSEWLSFHHRKKRKMFGIGITLSCLTMRISSDFYQLIEFVLHFALQHARNQIDTDLTMMNRQLATCEFLLICARQASIEATTNNIFDKIFLIPSIRHFNWKCIWNFCLSIFDDVICGHRRPH